MTVSSIGGHKRGSDDRCELCGEPFPCPTFQRLAPTSADMEAFQRMVEEAERSGIVTSSSETIQLQVSADELERIIDALRQAGDEDTYRVQ